MENNDAGYRRNAGTVLKNERPGEVVYTPPQDHPTIQKLMDNLVHFMNDEEMSSIDSLIKMAIIHHRFETIHPFYDGNGRTGRIINILYLVKEDLLTLPILYLSRYIIQYKGDYYHLLQQVRKDGDWEPWILFILKGVEETSGNFWKGLGKKQNSRHTRGVKTDKSLELILISVLNGR